MIGILSGVKYGKLTSLDGVKCSAAAWATWAALCMFCDWQCTKRGLPVQSKAGTCYPSLKQLSERAHLSIRAVRYALRELEALGYVRTEARTGDRSQYTLFPLGDAPKAAEADLEGDIAIGPENLREFGLTAIRNIKNICLGRGDIDAQMVYPEEA